MLSLMMSSSSFLLLWSTINEEKKEEEGGSGGNSRHGCDGLGMMMPPLVPLGQLSQRPWEFLKSSS